MAMHEVKTVNKNCYIVVAETFISGHGRHLNAVRLLKNISMAQALGKVGGAGAPIDPVEDSRDHLIEIHWSSGNVQYLQATGSNSVRLFGETINSVFDGVNRGAA